MQKFQSKNQPKIEAAGFNVEEIKALLIKNKGKTLDAEKVANTLSKFKIYQMLEKKLERNLTY